MFLNFIILYGSDYRLSLVHLVNLLSGQISQDIHKLLSTVVEIQEILYKNDKARTA